LLGQRQHQPNANPPPPPPPHNHIPPPPLPFNNIPHHHPPSPPHNQFFQPPPPQLGTIDSKSPLASHLQFTPWPSHYRAAPPHKYHGNTDPHKFLMCYEASIASFGGDEATLTKSLIISLEDTIANWYSRLHQDASVLGNNSKKSSCSISRGFKRSSIQKKILCPALKEKNALQFLPEVLTAEGSGSKSIIRSIHHSGYESLVGRASAQSSTNSL
jgi:hypothetical protein